MPKLHWRKQKTLAMLANRRQWRGEFYPPSTVGIEIEMEHLSNYYLVTQASISGTPTYIITE